MTAEVNFVRQQGFRDATSEACVYQYPALMWQPRAIGILVLVGLIIQAWPYFLALSALLWWNVALPRFNPFDALYNHLVGEPKRPPPLGPARSPRRFAQAIAGSFMLVIGLSLFFGWSILAWAFEALLVAALAALIFGRFCLGHTSFSSSLARLGLRTGRFRGLVASDLSMHAYKVPITRRRQWISSE